MRNGILGACGLMLAVSALSAQQLTAPAADPGFVDAARAQDGSRVRALLSRTVDVNVRSQDGSTALLWAAHWNDVATADLLIRAGANANVSNDFGMTPLSRACTNGKCGARAAPARRGREPEYSNRHR